MTTSTNQKQKKKRIFRDNNQPWATSQHESGLTKNKRVMWAKRDFTMYFSIKI